METSTVEILANELHIIWWNWYKYQRDNSTQQNIERWEKQGETAYKYLSEEDKEKDRKIARQLLSKIQPIEESNGWISVEERLPIEHGYYIVFHNGDVFVGFYDKCEKEWSCDFEDFKPTHWQPLPEPPLSIGDNK